MHFLRGYESLRSDVWLLCFENDADPKGTKIESIEHAWAPSGCGPRRAFVSHDEELTAAAHRAQGRRIARIRRGRYHDVGHRYVWIVVNAGGSEF